jgi:hypothetical protein
MVGYIRCSRRNLEIGKDNVSATVYSGIEFTITAKLLDTGTYVNWPAFYTASRLQLQGLRVLAAMKRQFTGVLHRQPATSTTRTKYSSSLA